MKTMQWNFLMAALLCVIMAGTGSVWAEETAQEHDLGQIIVTADRYPVNEQKSARFVTVLTAEQLEESGGNNVIDALKRSGTLSYKSLAPLGVSRMGMKSEVSIRGLEDGELVLINGVPIQSASGGSYDLNAIGLDQIERVEILSGAASTLYGADAMTGVINIITRQPGQQCSPYASVELGELGYQNHSVGLTSEKLNLGARYQRLDGIDTIYRKFSAKSPYRYDMQATDQLSASLNYRPAEHWTIDYLVTTIETGFVKRYGSPSKEPIFYDQDQEKHFADIRYEADNVAVKGFYSFDELTKNQTSPSAPEEKRRNYNYGFSGDYRFNAFSLKQTIGADITRRVADYDYSYGRHARDDSALFWQVKRPFFERLLVSAGAREQWINGYDGARNYSRFLPSAGLNFEVTSALHLFANAGKAFRAPSFNDQYYSTATRVGNPDLEPEEGWTYEAGMKYDHPAIHLRVAVFLMKFEDKIISYERADGMNSYYNAGDYENQGFEWKLVFAPFHQGQGVWKNLSFSARGFVANPKADDSDGVLTQVGPRVQTALGMKYLGRLFTFNVDLINLNDREDDLESEITVNLYSRYQLPVGALTFSVDNLFDEEVVTGGSTTSEYYGLGRLIKAGYEIRL